MRTTTLKTVIAALTIMLGVTLANAQQRTCTMIDVNGSVYFDRAWLFTVPGTTQGFDNGYDGSKFLNISSVAPQIYFIGTDGNYQISTVGDANNSVLGFIPGEDTQYTFTFTHTDLDFTYKALYLYDKITKQTIDIYAQSSTYSFTAKTGDMPDRFIFTAVKNTATTTDPVVSDNTTDDTAVDSDITTGVDNTTDEVGDDDNSSDDDATKKDKKDKKDKKTKKNKAKDVKSYCHGKKLHVKNPNKEKAYIKVVNARNGKVVSVTPIAPETTTTVDTSSQSGTYVIVTTVGDDYDRSTVIME